MKPQKHKVIKNWVSNQYIRKIGRRFSPFVFPGLWLVVAFAKIKKKILSFSPQKKSILLVAQNIVAADYARLVVNLMEEDKNLDFYFTDDQLYKRKLDDDFIKRIADRKIHIIFALLRFWDLIIFVNHPWGLGIWFAPFLKKIYINHGICTGKINNDYDEDGVYGKSRIIRPFSKPFYNKMFCPSKSEKIYALNNNIRLKNRLLITGFLRADILTELNTKRDKIRNSLGYKKNEIVVHIISTWGKNSLFQTVGERLLDEVAKITNEYRFIFSLHPRYDEFGDIKNRNREDILEKYRNLGISPQGNIEWDEYVIACDIAISDHSSLSLFYILLNKPVILVNVSSDSFRPGSVFDRLRKIVPNYNPSKNIKDLIENSKNSQETKQFQEFRETLVSFKGLAAKQYKEEIYRIIG